MQLTNFEVKHQQELEESRDIDRWLAHSPLVTGIQFESHGHCQKLEVVGSSLLPLAFGLKVALYPPSSLAKVQFPNIPLFPGSIQSIFNKYRANSIIVFVCV